MSGWTSRLEVEWMNDETKMDADINGRPRGISGQVIRRCPLVAGGTLYKNIMGDYQPRLLQPC